MSVTETCPDSKFERGMIGECIKDLDGVVSQKLFRRMKGHTDRDPDDLN